MATSLRAAIPIGVAQTFSSAPAVADWSTITNGGVTATFPDIATLDPAIQTNVASAINFPLPLTATDGTAAIPRYLSNATTQVIVTRPTGIGYGSVMATIQNTTAGTLSTLFVAYDLGNPTPLPASEDPELAGHRVFFSLTGAASSWTLVPELTTGTAGSHIATLALGSWPANALLYVLIVDDNGGPAGDGSYTIDNFVAVTSVDPPVITRQPANTNLIVGQTIRVSVRATGIGLTYAWSKDGTPLDTVANPSAATPDLVINNAQLADTGQYRCTVANSAGGVVSNPAQVNVGNDTIAPKFLRFTHTTGTFFRLIVDEPLCEGAGCPNGADALFQFNWVFEEVGGNAFIITQVVPSGGTNYDFEISSDFVFDNTKRYRLGPDPTGQGIADIYGNFVPNNTFITNTPVFSFQQGVDGYTGVEDTELELGTQNGGPDAIHGNIPRILVDLDNGGFPSHGLLRFNNLFGNGATQIPLGSRIISATLVMNHTSTDADGGLVNVHRMIAPWAQASATWNSMVGGIQADGVEAAATPDFSFDSSAEVVPFVLNLDCTASVQAWSDGVPNDGWALLPTTTDGYRFDSSILPTGPQLLVIFEQVPCPTTAPVMTAQPQPVTASEGGPALFVAGVSNSCNSTYQWQKNGVNINTPAATLGATYTIPATVPGDAGQYRLVVTKIQGGAQVISATASLTINPDLTPPVLQRAVVSSATTVTLLFSKQLGTVGTYTFSPVVAGVSASFANGANNSTVTVTSAARTLTTPYRLTILGVRDNRASQNFIFPNPTVVDLTGVTPVLPWANGGNWNYATNSQDANPNWKTGTFGPEWLVGQQFFGFESTAAITNGLPIQPDPIKTPLQPNDTNVLGFGNSEIFVSAYFVRQVTLPALEANTAFAISHFTDDGAIFYVDGVEIGRYQMPAGPVTFTTRSTGGNGEANAVQTFLFSASAGTHTLAVEVHQAGVSTSDVVFGLEINKVTLPSKLAIAHVQGTNIVSWTTDNGWGLTSAQNLDGNYGPVGGNPVRLFRVPPAAQTNHTFYRLHFTP